MARLRAWVVGKARGELSVGPLQGLRDAGAAAYELAEQAEALRQQPGFDPWNRGRGEELFLLCSWNAFALQSIADHLLEADAASDPATAGFLPQATFALAQACFVDAMTWVSHARCAHDDAEYRVNVELPAPFPPWRSNDTSDVHLASLRAALDAVAPRAEYDLGRLRSAAGRLRTDELSQVELVATRMRTAADFAVALGARARGSAQRQEVVDQLSQALRSVFVLGQFVAMPTLARVRSHGSLSVVKPGWLVQDSAGASIGSVIRLLGEPEFGDVSGIVISPGTFERDRLVRPAHVVTADGGVVRLNVVADSLELL